MDRGKGSLPSCRMTSKRSIKTPINRRFHRQNLKGLVMQIGRLGEEKYSKYNTLARIVEYNSSSDIVVEFQDEYKFKLHTTYKNWENNQFKNPYDKCIYGIACIGNAKGSKNGIIKKSYKVWYSMLNRCYRKNSIKKKRVILDAVCAKSGYAMKFLKSGMKKIFIKSKMK